ncbi:MarR family transcriptional regulator [Pelistega sp. NLN82]|uniref:MarR family transcriptional regulator n=1 Tax=Pelistega ratti TaxID=2652177 RepID=A0A6L9Y4M1_9BURK|nr:MarR family transcriptional regulator [Pelistega ratti]NEN74728.1 MarR family transcriptional regulator [Pelistega ratti]
MTFDVETRLKTDSSEGLKLWLCLHACNNQVENYIREQLYLRYKTTLPRFDFMAQLAGHKSGIKMGELSARMMVSNGNITTIATQLEKEALIERIINTQDRRSALIRLTPKGVKQYNKMAKSYEQWLEEAFSLLSPTNMAKLQKSLVLLKKALSEKTK